MNSNPIFVRADEHLVYFQLEGCDNMFCCTPNEWKFKLLRIRIINEFKVPEEILSDFEDIIREIQRDNDAYNS